jgi:type IV secretion system protein VirB5
MKLLHRHDSAEHAEPEVQSPYLDAQKVWLERYGSHISSAYNWRLLAMLEAVALVAAIVGLLFVAGQNRFVPYVVQVDRIGMPLAVRPAEQASPVDQRVVRAEIANFIVNARSVVTDRVVEKSYLDAVYAAVAPGAAAKGYLDSYYPGNSPFDRALKTTVEVSIVAILPISAQTYEVQWTETVRDLTGKIVDTQHWDGSVGVAITPPTDEATILRNPLGLYVTTLNWVRKI